MTRGRRHAITGGTRSRAGRTGELGTAALREGHVFLRRLEQRMRIVYGSAADLMEEEAPGLVALARRMGIRDRPGREAARALIEVFDRVTDAVRGAFDAIVA